MDIAAKTGIVVLAAGNSSRLGRPKQLLVYKEKTLIRRITEAAIAIAGEATLVVTGSNAEILGNELKELECILAYNPGWPGGMGSSIATGVSQITARFPHLTHILITVCDQPFTDSSVFQSLIQLSKQTGSGIVACSYAGTVGAPVIFSSDYFSHLSRLSGQEGAKKLVKEFQNDVVLYSFPVGSIDIDTNEDYQNLLSQP